MDVESIGSAAMAVAMIAAFLLLAGGIKLITMHEGRKGALMIVAAVVLVGNVLIWTI